MHCDVCATDLDRACVFRRCAGNDNFRTCVNMFLKCSPRDDCLTIDTTSFQNRTKILLMFLPKFASKHL
jgi:hypothetical protein